MGAKQAGPRGIGGWLVLVVIGMFISLVRIPYDMSQLHLPLLLDGSLVALSNPDHPSYHPLWVPLYCVEIVANLAAWALTAVALVLLFVHSRYARAVAIIWFVYGLALQVGDYLMWQLVPFVAEQPVDGKFILTLARSLFPTLVWVPYFLVSKRVRNTFVEDWPRLPWGKRATSSLPVQGGATP